MRIQKKSFLIRHTVGKATPVNLKSIFIGQGRGEAGPSSSSDQNNSTRPSFITTLSAATGGTNSYRLSIYHPQPSSAGVAVSTAGETSAVYDPHLDLCSPMTQFEELEPPLQIIVTNQEGETPPLLPLDEPVPPFLAGNLPQQVLLAGGRLTLPSGPLSTSSSRSSLYLTPNASPSHSPPQSEREEHMGGNAEDDTDIVFRKVSFSWG